MANREMIMRWLDILWKKKEYRVFADAVKRVEKTDPATAEKLWKEFGAANLYTLDDFMDFMEMRGIKKYKKRY